MAARRTGLWALLVAACAAPPPAKPVVRPPAPVAEATWPWPGAGKEPLGDGVARWRTRAPDGTTAELIEFDLAANPRLRFELYDQDEDDATPFDDRADFYPHGVGRVVDHLNETREGRVVAAWNGLFFAYDRREGPHGAATHIGPNVIRGKVRYNVGNHRWAFGVKANRPKALLLPDKATLAREFDFASTGAQLLVREGRPLRLPPFGSAAPRREPGPDESGSIPLVDWMRTSRTSMAWPKDGAKLWLLIVIESDGELGSKLALKRGEPDPGGWTLADLQRFWLAFGAWGAVNSDGGSVTQRALRLPEGGYDFAGAREGGTLMTFYVREAP